MSCLELSGRHRWPPRARGATRKQIYQKKMCSFTVTTVHTARRAFWTLLWMPTHLPESLGRGVNDIWHVGRKGARARRHTAHTGRTACNEIETWMWVPLGTRHQRAIHTRCFALCTWTSPPPASTRGLTHLSQRPSSPLRLRASGAATHIAARREQARQSER
jgi:hypothetical protein